MTISRRELERLSDLLLRLHEELHGDGEVRDEISHVRYVIDKILEQGVISPGIFAATLDHTNSLAPMLHGVKS